MLNKLQLYAPVKRNFLWIIFIKLDHGRRYYTVLLSCGCNNYYRRVSITHRPITNGERTSCNFSTSAVLYKERILIYENTTGRVVFHSCVKTYYFLSHLNVLIFFYQLNVV